MTRVEEGRAPLYYGEWSWAVANVIPRWWIWTGVLLRELAMYGPASTFNVVWRYGALYTLSYRHFDSGCREREGLDMPMT